MKKVFADKSICVAILVAISVVNLWVSFMMAAQLYAESRLIPHGVLVVSCFILLETLVALCHYLLQEMSRLVFGNPKNKPSKPENGSQFGEQETIPGQLDEEDRLDKIYTESNLNTTRPSVQTSPKTSFQTYAGKLKPRPSCAT